MSKARRKTLAQRRADAARAARAARAKHRKLHGSVISAISRTNHPTVGDAAARSQRLRQALGLPAHPTAIPEPGPSLLDLARVNVTAKISATEEADS